MQLIARQHTNEPDDLTAMRASFLRTASDRLKTPVTTLGLALQWLEQVRSEEEDGPFYRWPFEASGSWNRR